MLFFERETRFNIINVFCEVRFNRLAHFNPIKRTFKTRFNIKRIYSPHDPLRSQENLRADTRRFLYMAEASNLWIQRHEISTFDGKYTWKVAMGRRKHSHTGIIQLPQQTSHKPIAAIGTRTIVYARTPVSWLHVAQGWGISTMKYAFGYPTVAAVYMVVKKSSKFRMNQFRTCLHVLAARLSRG